MYVCQKEERKNEKRESPFINKSIYIIAVMGG